MYGYWLAEFDENSTSRYTIIGKVAVVFDDAINYNTISGPMASTYSFVYVQTDDLHAGVSWYRVLSLYRHRTGHTHTWFNEAVHSNIVLCALI
jgi:hypothetical protein